MIIKPFFHLLLNQDDPDTPSGGGGGDTFLSAWSEKIDGLEIAPSGDDETSDSEELAPEPDEDQNTQQGEIPEASKEEPEEAKKGLNLSGKEWAALRHKKKEQKEEIRKKAEELDAVKPQLEEAQSAISKRESELAAKDSVIEQLQIANKKLEEERDSANDYWRNNFKANVKVEDRTEYQQANSELESILESNLPDWNDQSNETIRVLSLRSNNPKLKKDQELIIGDFHKEFNSNDFNQSKLNELVLAFGGTIGISPDIGDEDFKRINNTLKKAGLQQDSINQLKESVESDQDRIAQKDYETRLTGLSESFYRPFKMSDDEISKALEDSQGADSSAIVAQLTKDHEGMSEKMESDAALLAKAVSLIPDLNPQNISARPLTGEDEQSLQLHQNETQHLLGVLEQVKGNLSTWYASSIYLPQAIKAITERDNKINELLGQQSISPAGSSDSNGSTSTTDDYASIWDTSLSGSD